MEITDYVYKDKRNDFDSRAQYVQTLVFTFNEFVH